MAGDWIKMRVDLAEDPAVVVMADVLGVHETHVVGMLHKCWSWANLHTDNGHAKNVTLSWLDRFIGVTGFGQAMESVGWLVVDKGLKFPDFDRHNGESAKKRATATERKRRQRESHANVTPMSRDTKDKNATREEKRREEVKDLKSIGRPAVAPPVDKTDRQPSNPPEPAPFELACSLYPKRAGNDPKAAALKAWRARVQEGAKFADMIEGVKRYAAFCTATGKVGTEVVMRRSTFFGPDKPYEQDFAIPQARVNGRSHPAAEADWWKSNDGIAAKGRELNVARPPADQMGAGWFLNYKLKVFAAAGRGPWLDLLPERLRTLVEAEMAEA